MIALTRRICETFAFDIFYNTVPSEKALHLYQDQMLSPSRTGILTE
jgi:hypothetical protein